MAQDLSQLTDQWMVNPWMFDPSQKSNQFSQFNNQALPWPPSYNTGAGGPVNAATGQPIPSFQQWQAANPGGMSINATPAAPAAPTAPAAPQAPAPIHGVGGLQPGQYDGSNGLPTGQPMQFARATDPSGMPNGMTSLGRGVVGPSWQPTPAAPQQQTPQAAAPQASGAPNNWYAALNALANPGNPVTQGATVPQVTGYQPSGGVNNAFLQQAGAGQGMNANFLNALRSIQARPQG